MSKKETEREARVYSIEEIAKELNASLKLIRRYVASGQLAAIQNGTKYSIPASSYRAFCDKYTSVDEETGVRKLGSFTVQFLPGLGMNPEEKMIKRKCKKARKVESPIGHTATERPKRGRSSGEAGQRPRVSPEPKASREAMP